VRLLAANQRPQVHRVGPYLHATVPSILDQEILAIEL
jgi:hypothetical protein